MDRPARGGQTRSRRNASTQLPRRRCAEAFLDVLTIFLRSVHNAYFNGTALGDAEAVNIRMTPAHRLMTLSRAAAEQRFIDGFSWPDMVRSEEFGMHL